MVFALYSEGPFGSIAVSAAICPIDVLKEVNGYRW